MITIKVRQVPNPDWPDGWAVFTYDNPELAQEHWEFLTAYKSDAVWIGRTTKTLQDGREVLIMKTCVNCMKSHSCWKRVDQGSDTPCKKWIYYKQGDMVAYGTLKNPFPNEFEQGTTKTLEHGREG